MEDHRVAAVQEPAEVCPFNVAEQSAACERNAQAGGFGYGRNRWRARGLVALAAIATGAILLVTRNQWGAEFHRHRMGAETELLSWSFPGSQILGPQTPEIGVQSAALGSLGNQFLSNLGDTTVSLPKVLAMHGPHYSNDAVSGISAGSGTTTLDPLVQGILPSPRVLRWQGASKRRGRDPEVQFLPKSPVLGTVQFHQQKLAHDVIEIPKSLHRAAVNRVLSTSSTGPVMKPLVIPTRPGPPPPGWVTYKIPGLTPGLAAPAAARIGTVSTQIPLALKSPQVVQHISPEGPLVPVVKAYPLSSPGPVQVHITRTVRPAPPVHLKPLEKELERARRNEEDWYTKIYKTISKIPIPAPAPPPVPPAVTVPDDIINEEEDIQEPPPIPSPPSPPPPPPPPPPAISPPPPPPTEVVAPPPTPSAPPPPAERDFGAHFPDPVPGHRLVGTWRSTDSGLDLPSNPAWMTATAAY